MAIIGLDASLALHQQILISKVNDQTETIFQDAVENTPVDKHPESGHTPGLLKRSWVLTPATVDTPQAVIENNAPYAGFVENGTEKMAPRGMLANAVNKVFPGGGSQ